MPGRLNSIFARRGGPGEPVQEVVEVDEGHEPPAPTPPPEPDPVRLRRERRALARQREIELRDVGGLAVEMVRRDRWKPELLIARAGDVLTVEQRMHELDSLLAAEVAARNFPNVALCKCGAPLPPGVHFCSHCGRAAPTSPPVVTCGHCGQPLPAEANFCGFCGNAAAAEEYEPAEPPLDETLVRPAPDEPGHRP
ncbi:MAG TPA: zinc ribbon domain-containing protein [Gaiellaceae bacterium]|nr:zinc ribbon domain-containing protein [Gaiellaceae bacterium]